MILNFFCNILYIILNIGNAEDIEKFNRRLVKVTKEHADEAKQLLKLMGIPYIDVSKNEILIIIFTIIYYIYRLHVKLRHNVLLW